MLPSLIIVFREVLEAALIVSILLAATRGLPGRGLWTSLGILAGGLGAGLVAILAGTIASALSGVGQEVFNAGVLFLAVGMLGWHSIWMSRHGRELADQASALGRAVIAGTRPHYVLAAVGGLAVLREGAEVVLFLYGIAASEGPGHGAAMLGGGLLGIAAGVGVGAVLYFGLLRVPTRHLFSVTNGMILLLAAGMASQGASFLAQADLLPTLGTALWDTSQVLPERNLLGNVLHTLVGYSARPDGIQVLFYALTLLTIGTLTRLAHRRPAGHAAAVTTRTGAVTTEA